MTDPTSPQADAPPEDQLRTGFASFDAASFLKSQEEERARKGKQYYYFSIVSMRQVAL